MTNALRQGDFRYVDFWMYGVFRFAVGKGSETPSCDGEKGLRLPRSSCSDLGNEGVSDPFPHRKRESQTLFPTAKGKKPVHTKILLAKIPLEQRMKDKTLTITSNCALSISLTRSAKVAATSL